MNKILVVHAFAKAEQEIKKRGVLNPSLTQMATELSDYLEEEEDFILGERSLRVYRGEALKFKDESDDINIKQLAVIRGLCNYLGYENYDSFVQNTISKDIEVKPISTKRKSKLSTTMKALIVISVITIIFLSLYNYSNRQRWMVWEGDHYVEVDFDAKKYGVRQLKLYKEDRVSSFVKVGVTCDTVFFNDDNSVRYWYGKNKRKELEYFTDLGRHPETGKTLKPITGYMIERWVCDSKN